MPTRRSARALRETLRPARGRLALLPRILPLGALDDTELLFEAPDPGAAFGDGLAEALSPFARRMLLTRLIIAWGQAVRHAIVAVEPDGRRATRTDEPLLVATSPADAWHLSGDLAALDRRTHRRGGRLAPGRPLGTDEFDRYWRITLDFLDVAITQYPAILQASAASMPPRARWR